MTVWRRLLLYEWRLVRRDHAVWLTAALLLVLTGAAWQTAGTWLASQDALTAVLRGEEARRLADLQERIDRERDRQMADGVPLVPARFGSRHATTVGHYMGQRWMVQPMLPTAPLALGERDLLPLAYMASVDRWQGQTRAQFTSPLWLRMPRFDLFFVIAYLFPLGLILVCSGLVASEKEQGTLQLRLTQGGRLWALGLGRLSLRGGILTLLLAVAVWAIVSSSGGSPAHLLIWEVGLAAYALLWLSLIAWIDAGGRSVAANLFACTGVWIGLLFAMPGLVRTIVDATQPVPARADFERAHREAYEDTWNGRNDEILAAFYAAHPEIPPDRDEPGGLERYAIFQMRALELMRQVLVPLERGLDEAARIHRRQMYDLRFVSPLFALHDVATTAAGTDLARADDFTRQRERFLDVWDAFYVSRIYSREPIDDLARTPRFEYQEPSLRSRFVSLAASLAALLVPAALLFVVAKRRYEAYLP